MKAKEVMKILSISRSTLYRYRKEKRIQCERLSNGQYEYDSGSVYNILTNGRERKTYIYIFVSSRKFVQQLANQELWMQNWCKNNIKYDKIFRDIQTRDQLVDLVEEILSYDVKQIIIYRKSILGHCFMFLQELFTRFGTEIVVTEQ
jgi:predicted site-specific integrase-resolvase